MFSCSVGLRYSCHWGTKHICSWLGYIIIQITPRSISSLLIQFYLLLQEVFYKDPAHRVVHPLMFGMPLLLCKAKKHTAVTLEKALNFMEDHVWPRCSSAKIRVGLGLDFFLQQLLISCKDFMSITAEFAHLWEKEGKKHFQTKSNQETETEDQDGKVFMWFLSYLCF